MFLRFSPFGTYRLQNDPSQSYFATPRNRKKAYFHNFFFNPSIYVRRYDRRSTDMILVLRLLCTQHIYESTCAVPRTHMHACPGYVQFVGSVPVVQKYRDRSHEPCVVPNSLPPAKKYVPFFVQFFYEPFHRFTLFLVIKKKEKKRNSQPWHEVRYS